MAYEFADLILDLDRHQVSRNGEPIKLTELSFKVLQVLVEAAPTLVSHDDLINRVWGQNRVVTPENLAQRMKALRQSLGDDAANPTYIEGVRGAGYRLVPGVRTQSASPSQSVRARPWGLGLAVVLAGLLVWFVIDRVAIESNEPAISPSTNTAENLSAAVEPQQPSIAILPFANMSDDPSVGYFSDGIHDDLLTRISNIKTIKTISRTSVMTYKGSDKKVGQIAKELGVNTILEGGVQRSGGEVRINLQLIDATSDAHLWAQTYTRELTATNLFTTQAEITEAVASALQAILSQDERDRAENLPTRNLASLEAYFKGKEYFHQSTTDGLVKSIEAYQVAIDLDEDYAPAYSGQALAILAQIWFSGFSADSQLEKSKPLIDRALQLDPRSSEAYMALGRWHQVSRHFEEAEEAYRHGLLLGPNNAELLVMYANLKLWDSSQADMAIDLLRRAAELDPQNLGIKSELAKALMKNGMAPEAITLLEDALAIQPDYPQGLRSLAQLYSEIESRHDKAIKVMRKSYALDPKNPQTAVFLAVLHFRLGDFTNTISWMRLAANLAPDSEQVPAYLGWAHYLDGDTESARREWYSIEAKSTIHWIGLFHLARIDLASGNPEAAAKQYEKYAPHYDGRNSNINSHYGLGAVHAYQVLGQQEEANALADQLLSAIATSPFETYLESEIQRASIYALLGQPTTAITILTEWVDHGGASIRLQIHSRFELKELSSDMRFLVILETINDRLSEQLANLARWEANGQMVPLPKDLFQSQ